jgi:hypothetical protein
MDDSGKHDFDFLHGDWHVAHRRLKHRLQGSDEWEGFGGTCRCRATLGGFGNFDDNVIDLPGGAYRAMTIRSFDVDSEQWAIWWLDARWPHALGVPMIGAFKNAVGNFFNEEVIDGRPIRTRFLWTTNDDGHPQWAQAMSDDDGISWEENWVMTFKKTEGTAR